MGAGSGSNGAGGGGGGALGGHAAMFDDFAAEECVWRATGNALNASATTDGRGATLTKCLDPDGPTRTNAALHPTNADSEERLCAAVWRLVRGGAVQLEIGSPSGFEKKRLGFQTLKTCVIIILFSFSKCVVASQM